MIAKAVIQKDGVFIKGFHPPGRKRNVFVKIELVKNEEKKARGFLRDFADQGLRKKEKTAWLNSIGE